MPQIGLGGSAVPLAVCERARALGIQTMRSFGMGSGPAGALLLTLAPVSLPSLIMVSHVFHKRVLVAIGLAVLVTGIVGGLIAAALAL